MSLNHVHLLLLQLLDVMPEAETCWVSVTVLPQTNTTMGRGHKFKVTAVMMTRKSALGFAWPDKPAEFKAHEVFSGEFGQEELDENSRAEEKKDREGVT